MSGPGAGPDRGYVLHSYPYRETSLLLQVWTERHGRFAAVAKGARRPRGAMRGVLVPFQPLSLAWFGRGEVKTLKNAIVRPGDTNRIQAAFAQSNGLLAVVFLVFTVAEVTL